MSDYRDLITADQVKALRAAYVPNGSAFMNTMAVRTVNGAYDQAAGLTEFMSAQFYDPARVVTTHMGFDDRERVILAVLCAIGGSPTAIAIHCYWALMEGIEVEGILRVLLLTSCYAGVDRYSDACRALRKTLTWLSDRVTKASADDLKPEVLVIAMLPAVG